MGFARYVAALAFVAGVAGSFSGCAMALGDYEVDPACSDTNPDSCGDKCKACAANQACDLGFCVEARTTGQLCARDSQCAPPLECHGICVRRQ
jgi:hypothetical protein